MPRLRLLSLLLACASSAALSAARAGDGEGTVEHSPTMVALGETFTLLEQSLAAGEAARVRASSEQLESLARDLVSVPDRGRPELAARLEAQTVELAALAREVRALFEGGRVEGARQAFGALRSSCVSCHVHYREGDHDRGPFPAQGGTLAGRVTMLDADGEPVDDRSNVLVFLERVASDGAGAPDVPAWRNHRDPPAVSQAGRRFRPRVLPVVRGTKVEFPNDDTLFHNVFSLSKTAPFDLGIYKQGETRAVRFERTGLVKLYCNIHPEMAASVVVLPGPEFALCDPSGRFALVDVPPGSWTLRVWTEMGGEARVEVEVDGTGVLHVPLEVRETERPRPHRNKFGREYGGKYS